MDNQIQRPKEPKLRVFHWIDASKLATLRVKSRGYIGGCVCIPFVITEDGKVYCIRNK